MGKSFQSERIIFFCRPPVAGSAKTRLGNFLGAERAAELYAFLLSRAVSCCDARCASLFSASPDPDGLLDGLFPGYEVFPQKGESLGQRMAEALLEEHARHPQASVLLVGTDLPDLAASHLDVGRAALARTELVFGPAQDGGYWAVGMRPELLAQADRVRELFLDIPWSTSEVLARQTARATALGLRFELIDHLCDLDDEADLLRELKKKPDLTRFLPDARVIIPVWNEAENLAFVLGPLFESGLFREVICADNDSTDGSRELAARLGARVTLCTTRGYGSTCLVALEDIRRRGGCDVVLFVDGDGADHPGDFPRVLGPALADRADLVLGQRDPELAEAGALAPHARFGNALATLLLRLVWRRSFRDLGPLRAVRWAAIERMGLDDPDYGWTIQMQIRAVRLNLRILEVGVRNRRRYAGTSKVTRNIRAIARAGWVILSSVFRERFRSLPPEDRD